MKSGFSISWLSSIQPRKQRKYRLNAPLHRKGKMVNVHLSKELRKKYGTRSVRVRKGDKVMVMSGQFKGKSGTVDRVDVQREKIFVTGVENVKKDGAKVLYPLHPSKIMITTLYTDDKKRFKKFSTNQTETKQNG